MNALIILFIVFYLLIAYGFRRVSIEVMNHPKALEIPIYPYNIFFNTYQSNLLLGIPTIKNRMLARISWLLWPITLGKMISMALLYYTCKVNYFLQTECEYNPNEIGNNIVEIKDILFERKEHISGNLNNSSCDKNEEI